MDLPEGFFEAPPDDCECGGTLHNVCGRDELHNRFKLAFARLINPLPDADDEGDRRGRVLGPLSK